MINFYVIQIKDLKTMTIDDVPRLWREKVRKKLNEDKKLEVWQVENNSLIIFLGFIGTLIGVMTPIIKLNSSITKLNTTIDTLDKNMTKSQSDIKEHDEKIQNHETRITVLEKRG